MRLFFVFPSTSRTTIIVITKIWFICTSCVIARSTQPKILPSCELTQRSTNVPDTDSIWKVFEMSKFCAVKEGTKFTYYNII